MSTKEILFIRHGESMYNKWRRESFRNPFVLCCVCDPMLFDAALSPAGEEQVRALRDEVRSGSADWADVGVPELVVTSPLTRAIETCLGAFFPESSYITFSDASSATALDSSTNPSEKADVSAPEKAPATYGLAPLCCALHREGMDTTCDVGTPTSELKEKYGARVDTSELTDEIWWYDDEDTKAQALEDPHLLVQESKRDIEVRIQAFRAWLAARPERVIAVVGHSAFIKQFTGMNRKLHNCEVRRYTLNTEE